MDWPSVDELNSIDMSSILSRVPDSDNFKIYVDKTAGMEHYRLLVWLSKQFNNTSLVEVGIYKGFSGCSLAFNESNTVFGFELSDNISSLLPKNYFPIFGNVLQNERIVKQSPLIMYDTDHNGALEREFMSWLEKINYKGIVLFDDIYLNNEMRSFWEDVKYKKEDISNIGHVTGTGAVWM
jgi:hypothetical protein